MEQTGYAVPLESFMDPPPADPSPSAPLRITVHPGQQEVPSAPDAGMQPYGAPVEPAAAAPAPARPIQVKPVDYTPDFSMHLHPVEHQPEFTDEQVRQIGRAAHEHPLTPGGGESVLPAAGAGIVQGYRDYADPFTKDEHGNYVADQPMIPNAGGKVPMAQKDYMNDVIAGADIASMLPIGGGGAVKAMFAGVGAKGADLVKLARAAELEAAGQHPSIIRQLTDWFRGADGKWRFEIPDTDALYVGPAGYRNRLKAEAQATMEKAAALRDPISGGIPPQHKNQYDQLHAHANAILRAAQDPSVPMHEVYDHPALYEQYPQLREVPTRVRNLGGTVRGQQIPRPFGSRTGSIELDTNAGTNRLTLGHEIQHEIQDYEQFARGGAYSTPEVAAEAEAKVGVRRRDLLAEMEELNKDKLDYLKANWGYTGPEDYKNPKYMSMADSYWNSHPEAARRLEEINVSVHQLNEAHKRALHDAYRRLAGEVESRNVEARAGMTPRELQLKEPLDTEDVPRDKQIVIRREGDVRGSIDDPGAVNPGLQEFQEPAIEGGYGRESDQVPAEAGRSAPVRPEAGRAGGAGGAEGLAEAQRAAADAAGSTRPLAFLPQEPLSIAGKLYIPGPIENIHRIAEDYMKSAGLKYKPLESYQPVKVPRAERIAEQYAKMKHAPNDPAVKESYDAMIDETVAQLKALQKSGLKIEFIKPGMADPYAETPRMAAIDVRDNNHLWVFPTDTGFGSGAEMTAADVADNPLLRKTGISIDGKELLANDAFRIVHDFFGHLKDGVGFRAGGEENAWRSHVRMYSAKARGAMTSETRGQNSWLNYGPHGAKNRTAKSADTIYADQKTGLMPNWTYLDGAADPYVAPRTESGRAATNTELPPNPKVQTVADPQRLAFPGIYGDPRKIAQEAAERVAPEDLDMKRLWGVSRGDLDEMAKGRVGNEEPGAALAKNPKGSLAAQNLQTPRNTQRLIDTLEEAGKHRGLKHADAWYILDPAYRRLEQLVGPEEAKVKFKRLNTLMGMASPGSEVLTEIQRGSHANMKVEQGRFDEFLKHAGTPKEFRKGPSDLRHIEAHPYHRTSHAEPMLKYLEHGKIMSDKPKVPLYTQASGVPETGFQTAGPVPDAHFSRGVGLADTRTKADYGVSASKPEYQTLQPWWKDEVAGELGLESVPAQARLWTALGPQTGVTSLLGQGKLELLTRQIMKTAKRLRITPEAARDMVLLGKAGAGAVAGAAVLKGSESDTPHASEMQKFMEQ